MRRHACLRLAAVLLLAFLHGATAHGRGLDPGPEHLWVGRDSDCGFTKIQDAIDATGPRGAVIHIVGADWGGISLFVEDRDIAFQGGHVACLDNTLGARTVLSAYPYRGFVGPPALTIRGASNVSAARVAFVDGGTDNPTLVGGGISFEGTGSLTLSDVIVRNNLARDGGGIGMTGVGGPALLWLLPDTRIDQNHATGNGGGIHLAGDATLRVHSRNVTIAGNQADEDGGGLAVMAGAHAVIGSTGFGASALIEGNAAQRGAGIAVLGADDTRASSLRVFSIDARDPTTLRGNTATWDGGALYAGYANIIGPGTGVQVCVSDTNIELNHANDGAAVLADGVPSETRALGTLQPPEVRMGVQHDDAACPGPNPVAYGARACLPGVRCNAVTDNVAAPPPPLRAGASAPRGGATPAPGAVLSARNEGVLLAENLLLRDNLAAGALLWSQQGSVLRLHGSVLWHNVSDGALLRVEDGGRLGVLQSTLADNDFAGAAVHNDGVAVLATSIVDVGSAPLFSGASSIAELERVLASNFTGVPNGALIASLRGEARFVDRAGGNLRLARDSLAIDFAPALPGTVLDLDGNERSIDAPRADREGPLDLGAYEWTVDHVPGRLFGDGLEDQTPPA